LGPGVFVAALEAAIANHTHNNQNNNNNTSTTTLLLLLDYSYYDHPYF
jgi:hypothetical protein